MIETRRLKNVVIFVQTILNTKGSYVLSNPIENSHQDESSSVMLTHVMKV